MLSTIWKWKIPIAAVVVAGGACAALIGGQTGAVAQTTYTVPLHQSTPITAANYGSQEKTCSGIPTYEDGWHFVLPGNDTTFVSLTVTFDPGGQKTITSFGPPSDKHAYVGSEAGAKLTAATATVMTADGAKKVDWFNLSHTCPATTTPPTTPPTPTPTATTPTPTPTATTATPTPTATTPTPTATTATPTPTETTATPTPTATPPTPTPTHTGKPPAPPAPLPSPARHKLPVTG